MTHPTSEMIPTPYGPARHRTVVAEGIDFLETDGHGYVRLDPSLHLLMPAAWCETPYSRFGYYEEDCDWALVALRFPAAFLAFDPTAFDAALGAVSYLGDALSAGIEEIRRSYPDCVRCWSSIPSLAHLV
jgi:hypothetical protein